jgi:hypothetical protein
MSDALPIGYGKAAELVLKSMSPRAKRLAELERWVDGTQYTGLQDWFADCPRSEKAPCVVEPIVADSIESHVDMVLGEGRFPAITSRPDEDDDDGNNEGGLDKIASVSVDKLIKSATEQVRFRAVCREALAMAMGCGTSCAIYGVRVGKLFGDTVKARWCEPTFAPDGSVAQLTIQYPYIDTYQDQSGEWAARARLFRRVIDARSDTTYLPAELDGRPPVWTPDPAQTFPHALGFCPVVWYPFFRGCSIVGEFDGNAPHANLLDEIRAHDMSNSSWFAAAQYSGSPQWTETGVELGSNPSSTGKIGKTLVTKNGGQPSADNPVIGEVIDATHGEGAVTGRGTGRKMGNGSVWQYEAAEATITLHTLPAGALKEIADNAHDIRLKIMQALAYVPLDPEMANIVRGSLSGKALESLRERQLNRDDKIRDDFGDGFIKPSANMLLRICASKSAGLRLRGLKKAIPILTKLSGAADAVG